jgi:diguanylate cyclase (GGDEF)-like protein
MEDATPTRGRLLSLFARSDDPYAGADIALARRFAVVLWAFGTIVVAVLSVFFPPTRAFGNAGWAVAGVGYVLALAIVWVLADKRRSVGFDFLFVSGFVGVVLIAASQHGAGGRIAPYHELFMFQLIGAALMHPPRRVVGFLVFVAAAMFAPVVYAPSTAEPGTIATELFLWSGLSLVLIVLMRTIRSQRLQLAQEGDEARQLARVDALTGLGNRRAFDEALDVELARSRRSGSALSLIVADLNGFKEINDRHGHQRGDVCLRQAAEALSATVRRPDLCFRWGGDEFAILLAGADAGTAESLSVRIEKAVARSCSRPGGGSLTLTCGYAALDSEMSAGEAVERADEALRSLKSHGRSLPHAVAPPQATPV